MTSEKHLNVYPRRVGNRVDASLVLIPSGGLIAHHSCKLIEQACVSRRRLEQLDVQAAVSENGDLAGPGQAEQTLAGGAPHHHVAARSARHLAPSSQDGPVEDEIGGDPHAIAGVVRVELKLRVELGPESLAIPMLRRFGTAGKEAEYSLTPRVFLGLIICEQM